MDDVYRGIAIASAAFVVLVGLWAAVRLHRERPFSMVGVLLAAVGPAIALATYRFALDVELEDGAVWGLLAGGAAAGFLFARAIPVYARGPGAFVRGAGWHLLPSMFAIAAIQVTGVRESFEGIILALGGMYAATGFTVAASALLLIRRLGVRPRAAPAEGPPTAVPAAGEQRCPRCGSPARPSWRYCMNCGAPL